MFLAIGWLWGVSSLGFCFRGGKKEFGKSHSAKIERK
jgi:hypothetical protein